MLEKTCRTCKLSQPIARFGKYSPSPDGLARICRDCRKIACAASRERHASRNRYKQMNRYNDAKALIMELKSQPCTDCGQTFPWFCMEYDHRDPATKIRPVSRWLGSGNIPQMLDEITRCDLVCVLCHRIRTHLQYEDGILHVGRPRKYA